MMMSLVSWVRVCAYREAGLGFDVCVSVIGCGSEVFARWWGRGEVVKGR